MSKAEPLINMTLSYQNDSLHCKTNPYIDTITVSSIDNVISVSIKRKSPKPDWIYIGNKLIVIYL